MNPKPLPIGLRMGGTQREVSADDFEHPVVVEAYSVSEAASALGKTEMTLRSWIRNELVPAPILRETTRNGLQYSRGELQIIADELSAHARDYSNLREEHIQTVQRIAQRIFGYRQSYV